MIHIKRNVSLKNLNTFGIGGPAKYYAEVTNESEVIEAAEFAIKNTLEIFVIGGGSDILVHDRGFDGLVIKYLGKEIKFDGRDTVTAEAGVNWDDLVKESIAKNLQGLECLSGIPGNVGAAPVQNIGAYGSELENCFLSLRAYSFAKNRFIEFNKKDCEFGYRDSFFKRQQNWQKYLITSVTFKLSQNGNPEISYDSLKKYMELKGIESPKVSEVREAVLALRASKLEDPKRVGNAGSFFKNPVVATEIPGIPSFKFENKYKLYAGWLIENAGWKGKTYKNAGVSAKNALQLINSEGKATAFEIKELSEMIQQDVYKKFRVRLEPEVQFIGFERKVAILGYGLEGQDAETYFKKQGAEITILDRKFDKNYLKNLDRFDLIVRSPGVYRYLPEIVQAEKAGVEVTSALKLFFEN
jgi:UDP-N-acetylmuramate dehydrogenase